MNTEVTLQMVEQVKPDAVVVATGSSYLRTGFSPDRPNIPEIPGANQPNVVTVEDVLQDKVDVGNKVVLVDNETDQAGVGTAEFLVERGKQVEIVTRHPSIGLDVPARRLSFALKRLFTHGAVVHNYHALKEIKGRTVSITNNYSQKETAIQDVDTVVLHTARKADNELYTALKGRVKELYAVGDCLAPRTALDAILDGHRLGRRL